MISVASQGQGHSGNPSQPTVFNPVVGTDRTIDLDDLSRRQGAQIQDEDDDMDNEELKEVMFLALDCSTSMSMKSGFVKDIDTTTAKVHKVLDCGWDETPLTESEAEQKKLMKDLLASIKKERWWPSVQNALYKKGGRVATRRDGAEKALEAVCQLWRDDRDREKDRQVITTFKTKFVDALSTVPKKVDDWKTHRPNVANYKPRHHGREIPHDLLCPIGLEIFEDPVVAADGFVYERENIVAWFKQCVGQFNSGAPRSPLTSQVLNTSVVNASHDKKTAVKEFLGQGNKQKKSGAAASASASAKKKSPPAKRRKLNSAKKAAAESSDEDEFDSDDDDLYNDEMKPDQQVMVDVHFDNDSKVVLSADIDEEYFSIHIRAWALLPDDRRSRLDLIRTEMRHLQMVEGRDGFSSYWPCQPYKDVSSDSHRLITLGGVRRLELYISKHAPRSEEKAELTRMEAVKQVFSAFVSRSQAYKSPVAMGLICFGNNARVEQKLTRVFQYFENSVNRARPNGDTCLFDALNLASDELCKWKNETGCRKT